VRIANLVIGGEVAGGQLVALSLARAARAAGHEPSFVSPTEGAFVEQARADGFAVQIVPLRGALSLPSLLRLRRAFRGVDLVHTHGHFAVNVLGRVAARLAGARAISHMHIENAFRTGPGRSAQIRLDNLTARLCFRIVAVSDATRATLVAQGYPAGRLVTVRNGIERAPVAAQRPARVPADAPLVGEVARLCEVKGQRALIRALPQLAGVWAVLAGEDIEQGGAFRRELEAEAEALGVADRVVFTGYRAEVDSLLAALDVFVLPSTVEGLPMTILEAMAQGTPVVATAVGGTPEVVSAETGVLVPPGDTDALATALRALLADRDRARGLGEAGRHRVETEFSEQAMAARVLALYAEAAA
jgi:glycosyltransferase involved in cell wall biosynthesis